jgi:hypothetical protein
VLPGDDEEILGGEGSATAPNFDGQGAALRAFIELIVEQPAASRLRLVGSFAAGPKAVAAMDGAVARFEELLERNFAQRPGGATMPGELWARSSAGCAR